ERGPVAGDEICANGRARPGRLDQCEAPRLAQAYRGREAGDLNQPLDRAVRQRITAKVPHITPPAQQLLQLHSKTAIEPGKQRHGFPYAPHRVRARLRTPVHAAYAGRVIARCTATAQPE